MNIPPPPPPLQELAWIPDGAINIVPNKVGSQIFQLPDSNRILKVGLNVHMSEVEAMRFVASHTSILVPHVYEAYERDGRGYIFMSKVEGNMLGVVWRNMSEEEQDIVVQQLRGYIRELRELHGDFYGALWNCPCEDIFFRHLCLANAEDQKYGPYKSRREYNEGLIRALYNSRPTRSLSDADKALAERVSAIDDDRRIFSHGDFHAGNIFVDSNFNVTGIIDWQGAGFSVNERDYLEALLRTQNPTWAQAINEIFPDDAKDHYETLKELDRALVLYSGI